MLVETLAPASLSVPKPSMWDGSLNGTSSDPLCHDANYIIIIIYPVVKLLLSFTKIDKISYSTYQEGLYFYYHTSLGTCIAPVEFVVLEH